MYPNGINSIKIYHFLIMYFPSNKFPMHLKIHVFWDVTPWQLLNFSFLDWLDLEVGGSKFSSNVCNSVSLHVA